MYDRYEIIKYLEKQNFKILKFIQFKSMYRNGFLKNYDCIVISKDKKLFCGKICNNDSSICISLNNEWKKVGFLNNYSDFLVRNNLALPQNYKKLKFRNYSIFLSHYYKLLSGVSKLQIINIYLKLIDVLNFIYRKGNLNKFKNYFNLINGEMYYGKGSEETYSSVEEIIDWYKNQKLGRFCFWTNFNKIWRDNLNLFDNTLTLVNGNLKLDDHLLKDKNKIIIVDWKRSCISSIVLDYAILKRRIASNENKNLSKFMWNLIDRKVMKINPKLVNLSNLIFLHRLFSEIKNRILTSPKESSFNLNPLELTTEFLNILDFALCWKNLYFCHQDCYKKTIETIKSNLINKAIRKIHFTQNIF